MPALPRQIPLHLPLLLPHLFVLVHRPHAILLGVHHVGYPLLFCHNCNVVASKSVERLKTFAVWDDRPDAEATAHEVNGAPTIVASDSQVALTMARNPTNKRSRHIGYRLQFVRDAVDYFAD